MLQKHTRCVLALITVSGLPMVAEAAWVPLVSTDDATATVYVDRETVKSRGEIRRFWDLHDLKNTGSDGERSRSWLREIDCKDERYRTLAVMTLSGPMGTGQLLNRWNLEPKWESIAEGTIAEAQREAVCAE